jgi:hypothetical protein
MELTVTKITQSTNGDFTAVLSGEGGVTGSLLLPVPPPEKEVLLYEVGQKFTLTAGPKPVKQPTVVANPAPVSKPPAPPAPVVEEKH